MPEDNQLTPAPISIRVRRAVEMTGISRSSLYELMRSGEIEFVKVGASTLILMKSLTAFIERQRARQTPAGLVGGRRSALPPSRAADLFCPL